MEKEQNIQDMAREQNKLRSYSFAIKLDKSI